MGDEDLNAQLKAAAEALVGRAALTSRFGLDCFALVDKLLRSLGAQTAADGDVAVTANADYDWGNGISLASLEPGDILQFREHVVHIETETYVDGTLTKTASRTLTRPHHTAIVTEVHKDGSVTVVEQNVHPNPRKVTRNVIPKLDEGEEQKRVRTEDGELKIELKIKTKVTGGVSAYRPAPKPQQDSKLMHPSKSSPVGGARLLANVVPAQGGAKRVPGPVGMEVTQPDDELA